MALSCLFTLASADAHYGLNDGFGGPGFGGPGFGGPGFGGPGFGRPPIAPLGFGRPPFGPGLGGFGGFGGAPGAFGGAFGGAPFGRPLGAFGGPYGRFPGAFGAGAFGAGAYGAGAFGPGAFGGAPFPGYGGYAPANYHFGYGVQIPEIFGGPADFGHHEERSPLGTVGNYHVNTPGSFQHVSYNVPEFGAGPIAALG